MQNDKEGGETSVGTFKKERDCSDINPGTSRTAIQPAYNRSIEFGT